MVDFYFVTIGADDRPLIVRPRGSLTLKPETAVVLGEAADGLPIVLSVSRRASIEQGVLSQLGVRRGDLDAAVQRALDDLEAAVRERARTAGVELRAGRQVYRSSRGLGDLLGPTLFARALGTASPLVLEEGRAPSPADAELRPITTVMAHAPDAEDIIRRVGTPRELLVPLDDGPPLVLEPESEPRPLLFEAALPDTRWHSSDERSGALDARAYFPAVRDAARIAWSVSRAELARSLGGLARSLAPVHRSGRIHGDLKPDNVLVLREGARAIDPVGVAIGSPAPAASPGWAAPEQILGRPVASGTDTFALGLLLARVLSAAIFGEEKTHVVPIGGGTRRRLRILEAPGAFVDPTIVSLPEKGRQAWQALVARALSFDPERRPTVEAFAGEVESLARDHAPAGRVGFVAGPGTLRRNVEVDGKLRAAWVVHESR